MSNTVYESTVIALLSLILKQLVLKNVTQEDFEAVTKTYWSR